MKNSLNYALNTGTTVYSTKIGYYNFQYPGQEELVIEQSTYVVRLNNWLTTNGLIPVFVVNKNAIPSGYNQRVVWVSEESMEKL